MQNGATAKAAILAGVTRGFYVTSMMGFGFNAVTGDFSRGASGLWIQNGELTFPVEEITVAGNLRKMFAAIEAVGTDIDPRSHIRVGSILVGRMTVAGGD